MFYTKCITLFKTYWPKTVSMQRVLVYITVTGDNPDCLLLDRAQMCIVELLASMKGGQQEEKVRQPN